MTHSDIYTKFMIEYDKADVTSSYPSLTKYEIATLLDKAYLALIAQKFTGTNSRKVQFEGDRKNIDDLSPLVTVDTVDVSYDVSKYVNTLASNELLFSYPSSMLYYIQSSLSYKFDNNTIKNPTVLLTHEDAQKFKNSGNNLPWIENPIVYLELNGIHVLHDRFTTNTDKAVKQLIVTYIKQPTSFVTNINKNKVDFELSDSVAEELINLAIAFALETVESQRLQSKLNISQLES